MKKLVLIRHAKSSWKFSELTDLQRPLKKRGLTDAALMGRVLKDLSIMPDAIITSPAVRAKNTARLIAKEILYDEKKIKRQSSIYMESKSKLIDAIKAIKDDYNTVYVVGHNPGLTDVANFFTGESVDNIPTSGVFGIEFECNTWREVEKEKGKKLFFEVPKTHRDQVEKIEEQVI